MRKRWIVLGFVAGLGLLEVFQLTGETTAITSFVSNSLFKHNLHAVVPGEFYRSAQMDAPELHRTIQELGVKSVIDLRYGKQDPAEVEKLEEDVVRENSAQYYHFPMLGSKELPPEKILELLELYSKVEKPILVHCSSGSHRSGVASVLYLLGEKGLSAIESADQLSPRFGYFRWERELKGWIQGHPTIDHTLWQFQEEAAGRSVKEWAESKVAEPEVRTDLAEKVTKAREG